MSNNLPYLITFSIGSEDQKHEVDLTVNLNQGVAWINENGDDLHHVFVDLAVLKKCIDKAIKLSKEYDKTA